MSEPGQQGAGPGPAGIEGLIGTKVGNFKLTEKVGAGGMGVVYIAEHQLMGKKAAVKVLLPELSTNKEIVTRFFNEARAATRINHPGIVDIYDFGYHQTGHAYIVMEYLAGQSLTALLKQGLHFSRAVDIAWQLGSALGAAHQCGIIHRDVKPDNVFILPDPAMPTGDRVKVLDFGIAKLAEHDGERGGGLHTRTGALMGTPVYMSPEQCRGAGEVDHRSDIYAMGVILYEMACGRPPFVRRGFGELITAHMYEPPPRLSALNPSVPPEYEAIVMRMLEKDPAQRYQSTAEVEADLGAINPELLANVEPVPGAVREPGSGRSKLRRRRLSGVNPVSPAELVVAPPVGRPAWMNTGRRRMLALVAGLSIAIVAIAGWLTGGRKSQRNLMMGSAATAATERREGAAAPRPAAPEPPAAVSVTPAETAATAAKNEPASSGEPAEARPRPVHARKHTRESPEGQADSSGAGAPSDQPAAPKKRNWGDLVDF